MAQTGLAVAASVWGVLMGIAPVLQIRRMLREGSSRDVSLAYFTILLIGFLLWIAYGAAARLPALVIPNSAALVVGTAVIVVALRLRQRRRAGRRKGIAWVRPGGAWISFGRLPRERGRGLSSQEDQHTPS
jgi:MtN3 and saliva related transmembrane protein